MGAERHLPGMVRVHHQAHQIAAPEKFLHQSHHDHGTEEAQHQSPQPAPGTRKKDDARIKPIRARVNSQQIPVPGPGGMPKPGIRPSGQAVRYHGRGQPAQDTQHAEQDSPGGGFPPPIPINGLSPPENQGKANDCLYGIQPLFRRPSPPGCGRVVPFQQGNAKLPHQGKAHEYRKRRHIRLCFQHLRHGVHEHCRVRKEFPRNVPCGCRPP